MLTLERITKDYGSFRAVEDISIEFENGLYGMLAPNGAGKTTIIKMIVTLLYPTEGKIYYHGVEINEMGANYRELIGYLPQEFGYYKNNTPVQYLEYLSILKGMEKKDAKVKIKQLLEQVGLGDVADKKMKKFSGGMLQRVGVAQAMLNDPKVLILDEPTAGLDPKERVKFRNIISALSKDRIVILSTHIVSDIESIANQVIMIKDKHLHKMDTVANICDELMGKIFECQVSNDEYETFEQQHLVLSARQEREGMNVRYYADENERVENNGVLQCMPNLEDVFLVTYRGE